jgi:hypothetical protein
MHLKLWLYISDPSGGLGLWQGVTGVVTFRRYVLFAEQVNEPG